MKAPQSMLPVPSAIGLPERFSAWRPHQESAVQKALDSKKRFVAIVAPTGFGKTITAATIAEYFGDCVYCVETKALMGQIENELGEIFTTVKGRGNYDCIRLNDDGIRGAAGRCDKAQALCGKCALKENGCHYYDAMKRAIRASHVLTNYAYWMYINEFAEEGLHPEKRSLLILDEAHAAADQLSGFLRIDLEAREVEQHLKDHLPGQQPIDQWKEWAAHYLPQSQQKLDRLKGRFEGGGSESMRPDEVREFFELRTLVGRLAKMVAMQGDWVEDRDWKTPKAKTSFEPIWPGPYREKLFLNVPKVLLMSATIRPKSLELLGIKEEEFDFLEFPSSFPSARRPVVSVPTVVQRYSMDEVQKIQAVRRVDQIINGRLDRKGIIHTTSFERAKHLLAHSKHSPIMLLNESRNTVATVERFKRMDPPVVLVSPSVTTGFDFPFDECEYQIILKVPFPDTRSPIAKARQEKDQNYGNYLAMIQVVQAAGRGMRSADDQCEVLVIDDSWGNWFLRMNRQFAPNWFLAACRQESHIPQPLKKL